MNADLLKPDRTDFVFGWSIGNSRSIRPANGLYESFRTIHFGVCGCGEMEEVARNNKSYDSRSAEQANFSLRFW